ncbi:hypothetical protein DFA_11919 [Cavenderia fasciculata]|uniref:Uncharacterized protein n=1 Tax=Cavenderia fasciculata TaxID=261658 RepID=F4QEU5_CACFS|nr:uncharacterized protein DFA_11919 [Cavenderia fasciculata]EGG14152.1 hypothetical protein DFA_11919 [Cavenderia fasciculata]|eukprot:XP_004350860.1 hypothetical protein DFA_11919 [Cavenderia fasciculata]
MNIDKIFKLAKGFYGRSKNCKSLARERVEKGLEYNYVSRRLFKRDMRSNFIQRINAGARQHDLTYNSFTRGMVASDIHLNRKVKDSKKRKEKRMIRLEYLLLSILSELAVTEPFSFKALTDVAKTTLTQLDGTSYLPKQHKRMDTVKIVEESDNNNNLTSEIELFLEEILVSKLPQDAKDRFLEKLYRGYYYRGLEFLKNEYYNLLEEYEFEKKIQIALIKMKDFDQSLNNQIKNTNKFQLEIDQLKLKLLNLNDFELSKINQKFENAVKELKNKD